MNEKFMLLYLYYWTKDKASMSCDRFEKVFKAFVDICTSTPKPETEKLSDFIKKYEIK